LLAFLDHSQSQGFLRAQHRSMLQVADTPSRLLEQFENYMPPIGDKWRT
jgi:predicted Rossmann-fold nucleotide-binding protein